MAEAALIVRTSPEHLREILAAPKLAAFFFAHSYRDHGGEWWISTEDLPGIGTGTSQDLHPLLNISEVARLLRLSRTGVKAAAKAGKIPSVTVCEDLRFPWLPIARLCLTGTGGPA